MYLLDTNSLIYFFKGVGDVASHLLNTAPKDVSIPAIAYYELQVGIRKSTSPQKRITQLHQLTQLLNIIAFGAEEAVHAANIRAALERRGQTIGPYALLIAGTALAHALVLVSHNTDEFTRIADLKVVDWF